MAYSELLDGIASSLLGEVAAAVRAISPRTEVRLIGGGVPDNVIRTAAPHLDAVVTAYPRRLEEIAAITTHLRALGARGVRGGFRAIAPLQVSDASAARTIGAWRNAGANGLNVYNYGLMASATLAMIGRAIRNQVA